VFSGQPYPELDEGVRLTKVPSLDLYREPDPFRVPHLREFRDLVDVEEFLTMCTAGFPEPKTFGTRVARLLRERVGDFDVVHDNQVLSTGLLEIERLGLPLVTTIHHPITVDRRLDLAAATTLRRRLTLRRWYGFLRMQRKVARQARWVLTPSTSSKRDIVADFGVDASRVRVIPLGVDDGFRPPSGPRVPGRIVAMASADAPMKGIVTLLEAFAKLRTERPELELLLVTKPQPGGRTHRIVDRLAIRDHVRFVHGVSDVELVEIMGSAEVGCVPSLYEGFSLPTAELMACGTPLVVSDAGAIPEVVGPDGLCADLVRPGDVEELAGALARLLDDRERRERYGAAGRARVDELFSWRAAAAATAAAYEEAIRERSLDNRTTRRTRLTDAHR
jgi:glycosyltransferase involved in cell wall biosynthesis